MARAVINRRTGEKYESAPAASQVLSEQDVRGASENNIGLAARATEDGLYATAAGDQWAFVDGIPQVWPEKGKPTRPKRKTARAQRKAQRKAQKALVELKDAEDAENHSCPVTGERCPYAEFVGHVLDMLRDESTNTGG